MEKKTAEDAAAFCNGMGSKLFEPRDFPSNAFVTSEAKAIRMSQFWIGIRDVQTEGTFRYDSNAERITWNNWNSGQPNNEGGEDCTIVTVTQYSNSNGNGKIDVNSSEAGQWWDTKCDFRKAFVCERAGNLS